ncbi:MULTISPECIES: 23S rRNA (adenine(1618)-N(6))-methyltransferase RlmF [unclassified Pseudoalteromonas]|uniref:23S rRNA (adenine(1618)-N(6))-methyltransferase RlmF n=1 Tax=unclassified Pseudoalteromonas TaxID=194690 RepID=UPI000CF68DB4|nr:MULTISPECIES: 23S rRNA (adenine(1618)-N(6))-methyltransferase RlmF [unclassified Pseudoalteromonas]MBS3797795.1 23S rRNA (adenine(1618)-N(6))-methyltransferase RlmF [Pseudoalteromonas sp. BDTF-M6]
MHPQNRHRNGYDFDALCSSLPNLQAYVVKRPDGQASIDFSDAKALKTLNQALLKHHYDVAIWDLPEGFLCPPVPGRADYLHHLYDLISQDTEHSLKQPKVRVMDVGTGASLIYPILGNKLFNWQFLASDIDVQSVKLAKQLAQLNALPIKVIQQKQPTQYFAGIIKAQDTLVATLCNPPFHDSEQSAQAGSQRKWRNLKGQQSDALNFGGRANELWCQGGELAFIRNMALESQHFAEQVIWFTSLVSKKENERPLKSTLRKLGAEQIEVVAMAQGQKSSRFIAWTFMDAPERRAQLERLLG